MANQAAPAATERLGAPECPPIRRPERQLIMRTDRNEAAREAIVALARRLAVILHRIGVDGTEFRWTREQTEQWHKNRAGSNLIGGNSSSTTRWNDVPRGTMEEVSSHVRLDLSRI